MNSQTPSGSRTLSTSARVHPPYLPYLHSASRSRGKGLKWIPPLAAIVGAGYAVHTYRETQLVQRVQGATTAEQAEAARRQRDAAMADAYGSRGSLEELERAVALYEAQRGRD